SKQPSCVFGQTKSSICTYLWFLRAAATSPMDNSSIQLIVLICVREVLINFVGPMLLYEEAPLSAMDPSNGLTNNKNY
ncbi:MAG: hypothetical protein ACI8RD_014403, partial [Bacillariaceae sp.]